MSVEAVSAEVHAWARRHAPRSLDDAPPPVRGYVKGLHVVSWVFAGLWLVISGVVALTGPTLVDKVTNFAGVGLFVGVPLALFARSLFRRSLRVLTDTPAEGYRVTNVRQVVVRTNRGPSTVTEVQLAAREGPSTLFVYWPRGRPPVGVGAEAVALREGKRALVLGLGETVLDAMAASLVKGAFSPPHQS